MKKSALATLAPATQIREIGQQALYANIDGYAHRTPIIIGFSQKAGNVVLFNRS